MFAVGSILVLAACAPAASVDAPTGTLSLRVGTEMPSYVEATWTSDADTRTRLELASPDGPVLVTDWHDGAAATDLPILGLWAGDTFTASLVDEAGHVLTTEQVSTGAGVDALGSLHPEGTATWSGYLATALIEPGISVALLLAPNGRAVWSMAIPGAPILRVLPRADGRGMWALLWAGDLEAAPGRLVSFGWDGSPLAEIVPYGHQGEGLTHDFLARPDDTLVFLGTDTRLIEGTSVVGDAVFRMSSDGAGEEALWSAWDSFTPATDLADPTTWTHANTLRWSEDSGTAFVGLRGLSTLVELDGASFAPIHIVGSDSSDLVFIGDGELFHEQHGFDVRGDRIALHDNRSAADGTRLAVYDLDREGGTVRESWEFLPDPALFDYVLGDATWVDDDTLLANWSTSGLLDERDLDGSSPWALTLDLGRVFGYSALVPALPGSAPVAR